MQYFYSICPVGSDPDFAAKKIILETLGREFGQKPFFPLERHQSFSLDQMGEEVQMAAFVLADLSLERPSCYFELGVAQAFNARVRLIAAEGTTIHQTGCSGDAIFY